MNDNWGRVFGALAALSVLWIVVYWWWEPRARISLDSSISPGSARAEGPVRPPSVTQAPAAGTGAAPAVHEVSRPAPVAVIPPKFREYTVRAGETLDSIAVKELGSRGRVEALRQANPLMDPARMKAGRTIRIPLDPDNISGKPVANAAPAAPPADAATEEYTVLEGESLSAIAKARYGSTKYADLIYQANKDSLSSPDSVREGQKLRLPPKPQ